MALSGTLDTFALPDVLRLLSSTSKSGRLRITGDRGSGSVWVDSGAVVATELASAMVREPSNAEVVFGLLRFSAGSFTFEADATSPKAAEPEPLEPILGTAEIMLVEWRTIEEVIPSLDLWIGLCPEIGGADVMIDQLRWKVIASIGSGAQVGAVASELEMNEIDSCRLVKELMDLGLVQFIDEPAGLPAPTSFEPEPIDDDALLDDAPVAEAPVIDEPVGFEPIEVDDTAVIDDPLTDAPFEEAPAMEAMSFDEPMQAAPESLIQEFDSLEETPGFAPEFDEPHHGTEPSLAALASTDEFAEPMESLPHDAMSADPMPGNDMFAGGGADAAEEELDPAEMARQLANLSPKAAKAVAAAAKATTEAERDAALAAVEAEDDSVNRGLLLKFLGSVDS